MHSRHEPSMVGAMTPPDADTPYCRLYIDTKADREAVQTLLSSATSCSRLDAVMDKRATSPTTAPKPP